MRSGLIVSLVLCLGCTFLAPARADSPLPFPHPDLNFIVHGTIEQIVRQPDNTTIIAGSFATINGVARPGIFRVLGDGTIDPDWNPAPNGDVWQIVRDPSTGSLFVYGSFTVIGGNSTHGLAKISGSGTGASDPAWDPAVSIGGVWTMVADGAGSLYIGGDFQGAGGQARSGLAKLSTSGEGLADSSWDPSPNQVVEALALDGAGHLYVGGHFSMIGGQPVGSLARISATGSGVADPGWTPFPNNDVEALAWLAGHLYAAGAFTLIGSEPIGGLADISTGETAIVDPSFNPAPDGYIRSLSPLNGALYVIGQFHNLAGVAREGLARINGHAVDPAWNPAPNGWVRSLAIDAAGNFHVGGDFSFIGGDSRLGYAELSPTGIATATEVDAEYPGGFVFALAAEPGGGVIVGGQFDKVGAVHRANLLRLAEDGTLDTQWRADADMQVNSVAVDASGAIYAGGAFAHIGGQARNHIAKLHANGAVDASWNPSADGPAYAYAFDGAGSVYVGGAFTTVGGVSRNALAKLSTDGSGSVDASWNPAIENGAVYGIALDADTDSIFVSGAFTGVGGLDRVCLFKAEAGGTGHVDASWDASTNGAAGQVALDGHGHLFVTGGWTEIGGVQRNHLAKVSTTGNGQVDADWNPAPDVGPFFAYDGDGSLYVGASGMTLIGGVTRMGLAKVSTEGVGVVDPAWQPSEAGTLYGLVLDGRGAVYIGGRITSVSGQPRMNLAALPTVSTGEDLHITVDDGVDFAENGSALSYAIVVHNDGASDALAARVRDILPVTLSDASWTCTADAGSSCGASGFGNIDDTAFVASGTSITYQLAAIVTTSDRQPIVNTATVDPLDATPGNNTATDVDRIGVFVDGFDGS